MAQSLFNNKNTDVTTKYRERNEETIRRERANALDEEINKFANAKRDTVWANSVIDFCKETLTLNEDILDILVNVSLIKQLEKEAKAFIARQKEIEKEENAKKEAEKLALKLAAEKEAREKETSELKETDDAIAALSKSEKGSAWAHNVTELKENVKKLPVVKRSKLKNLELLDEICKEAELVIESEPYLERIEKFVSSKTKKEKWANDVVDFCKEVPDKLAPYVKTLPRFKEILNLSEKVLAEIEKERDKAAYEKLLEQEKKRQTEKEIVRLKARIKNAEKGDTITFGSYAPDGVDEKKPIEWTVLKGGKHTFLVTKHVIERHKVITAIDQNLIWSLISDNYSDKEKASFFNWNRSAVRKWLNGKFFEEAFSDAEKSLIGTCDYSTTYTRRAKSKKVVSKVESSVRVYLPDSETLKYRVFKKYRKVKALSEINRDELIVRKKGVFNVGNVTYLLSDFGVDEAKFKGKRFNKYYVYVCDGKGKIRKFYLNEKPIEYVLAKELENTPENKDDAVSKAIDAFASEFAATHKLAEKFSVLGLRPMMILDLSE